MTIYESDLPGVGKKFEVELEDGERLVIVTHNTGKREVYLKANPDADGDKLFEVSDRLARKIGTILEGAYFQPVQAEAVETMLSDDTYLEWYNVAESAEIAGQTLEEADIRDRTGVSVIAIQRGDDLISPPTPETVLQVGDTLVVIGEREECAEFETLLGDEV
ncbi:cation:proton antiporter regulatory subunit [Haloterrigena sp. SYSU A558-1]|uniref:Cation:proton antiporter regulatory subunit n=1 Tax=Haloterrigena gelatinilytica TaxID=2741724 RepID=A0A8J8KCI8_9EURY|nr:cation:proton antiporter regulatory subunit [Haloterrigena gelatinilytica]NUB92470.1 cation:proton antiporter regulatory subunit [Haloterrigena gelatinilytica]NUC71613.1 cation:proton antiporter regulatory subunit [Haloterrigena gelatinilytica]